MSPSSSDRRATWLTRPAAAATVSLLAVMFFIGVLGIVFLPREAQRLAAAPYVSITHWLEPTADRPAIALFWTMMRTDRRGWSHHVALHSPDAARPSLRLLDSTIHPLAMAPAADADHVLLGDWDGTIYLLDLNDPASAYDRMARQADGGVIALASSPDGQYLVSQSPFHIYGWDLTTRRLTWRLDNAAPYCFAIRPDSTAAIVGTRDGEIVEIDLSSGRTLRTLAHCYGPAFAIAITPDGKQLAILQSSGGLLLVDSHSGALGWGRETPRFCQTAAGRFIAFSPCGKLLVTAGQLRGDMLTVWDVATGEPVRDLLGHERVVLGARFAADGSLHSWGADGTIRSWDLRTGAAMHVAAIAPALGPG